MAASKPAGSDHPRVFKEKVCAWCGGVFTPTGARQKRCDDCRATKASDAGRCDNCGATVSGRARWGSSWGGECDRAEERVSGLMEVTNG